MAKAAFFSLSRLRKSRIALIGLLVVVLALIPQMIGDTTYVTSAVSNILFENNLHEVVPGRFYRSGQMSREDLDATIRKYGIKSVIDLRLKTDSSTESSISERQVVEKNGGRYYHVPLKSNRAEQRDRLEDLLTIYDGATLPILVHCSSGTHRTGVASAMWLLDKEHESIKQAEDQLSAKYGFFRIERIMKTLVQGNPTLDTVLTRYADETAGANESFRDWLAAENDLAQPLQVRSVSALEPTRFFLMTR